MILEIELLTKESSYTNTARKYLKETFFNDTNRWLRENSDLNSMIYLDHYIMYHVPDTDLLKPRAIGVIGTFAILIVTSEDDFISKVLEVLEEKKSRTEWITMFRIFRREEILHKI
jgi:hypothetical protein